MSEATTSKQSVNNFSKRVISLDLLKGLIMVLMAIDHASFFIAKVHYSENWGVTLVPYDGPEWFLTRFVSHLCAPGFFFLMGMGMIFFTESRLKAGWSLKKIRWFFIKRGFLLILVQFFLEGPAWLAGAFAADRSVMVIHPEPGAGPGGPFIMAVLFSLGTSMIIGSFLLRLSKWWLSLLSVAVIGLSVWFISSKTDPHQAISFLETMFLVPGVSEFAYCKYPVLPWLGLTTAGMALAFVFLKDLNKGNTIAVSLGFILVGLFFIIRLFIPLSNYESQTPDGWISFFTLIKYPPSLAFLTLTLGINLLLLRLFAILPSGKWQKPLLIFGKTAFFFYIVHLYVYMLIGIGFRQGTSLGLMYLFWFIGLFLLYFLCSRYLAFKKTTPIESVWRFF